MTQPRYLSFFVLEYMRFRNIFCEIHKWHYSLNLLYRKMLILELSFNFWGFFSILGLIEGTRKPNMPKFVIQKHHASQLHYDLRLEMDGVLKSWAVPKEPSTDSTVKRLAIQVEDHELDYADFEGEIEEGQYGAGTVEIWDSGNYKLIERSANLIRFHMYGKKLCGEWKLVHTRYPPGNQWLLIASAKADALPK